MNQFSQKHSQTSQVSQKFILTIEGIFTNDIGLVTHSDFGCLAENLSSASDSVEATSNSQQIQFRMMQRDKQIFVID